MTEPTAEQMWKLHQSIHFAFIAAMHSRHSYFPGCKFSDNDRVTLARQFATESAHWYAMAVLPDDVRPDSAHCVRYLFE